MAEFDAQQRRSALNAFIDREGLVVSAWEKAAGIGDGTLRKFLKSTRSDATLTDKTYQRLAEAASRDLKRTVLAAELQAEPAQLSFPTRERPAAPRLPIERSPPRLTTAQMPVYASAAGGPEGAWVLSSDPIAWMARDTRLTGVIDAFGCQVMGDSMEMAYEPGNLLLVNPAVMASPGDDVLLVKTEPDGTRYALIKRLVKHSGSHWTVKQFNPQKTYSLPKAEWQQAMLVIGKYNRG